MAQKSKNKNKNAASRPRKNEPAKKKNTGAQVAGVALFFLALAVVISLFFDVGGAGTWIRSVLRGLFGFGAYLLPIILVVSGVYAVFPKTERRGVKLICGAIMFASVCGVFALFHTDGIAAESFTGLTAELYNLGRAELFSGGVVGGYLGYPLSLWLGGVFAALIICFILVVSLIYYCDVSLAAVFSKIGEKIKASREKRKLEKEERAEAEKNKENDIFGEPERKRTESVFNGVADIDIPVDDPLEPEKKKKKEKEKDKKRSVIDVPVDSPASPAFPDGPVAEEPPEKITVTAAEKAEMIKEIEEKAGEKPKAKPYRYPPLSLISKGEADNFDASAEMRQMAEKIVSTLASFGVETRITNITRGPSVTRFELVPGMGVKISKVANLSNDLALALAASRVRIEAPIPGKAAIGIEVPNRKRTTVYLRDILNSREFTTSESFVTAALGKDIGGMPVIMDIAKMPHVLVAGSTGSGKSVCINSIIVSLIYKASPEKVKLIMIDPKMVELSDYNGIPHLLIPVVTDPKKAAGALLWAVAEMEKRYQLLSENSVREIFSYNALAENDPDLEPIPQIVIIIDEFADLMMTAPKDVEDAVCRIAQKARAVGMHLIVATQRPSADVLTGLIKANIPSRIAFAVASGLDSRIILDQTGAEKLIGRGDMLYNPLGCEKPIRAQGCFVPDKDISAVIAFVKANGTAAYDEGVIKEIEKNAELQDNKGKKNGGAPAEVGDSDPMTEEAIDIAIDARTVSTSMLQRRLKLGYGRAARIIDEMEERGIVGPPDGSKPRQVLISKSEWNEIKLRQADVSEMQDKV